MPSSLPIFIKLDELYGLPLSAITSPETQFNIELTFKLFRALNLAFFSLEFNNLN